MPGACSTDLQKPSRGAVSRGVRLPHTGATVGILVHGDNHFIVRGPLPDRDAALALVRHWSLIQIGATTPPPLYQWHIISREFRENLEWAVVVPGDDAVSPAVTQLLDELSVRGITIHDAQRGTWSARRVDGSQL